MAEGTQAISAIRAVFNGLDIPLPDKSTGSSSNPLIPYTAAKNSQTFEIGGFFMLTLLFILIRATPDQPAKEAFQ
jgi:hypothetical protein